MVSFCASWYTVKTLLSFLISATYGLIWILRNWFAFMSEMNSVIGGGLKQQKPKILINYCPFNIITLPNTFRIFYHPHVFMNTIQSCYSSFSCKSFWVCWPWGNWWGCRPNFWKMDCVSLENTCCAPVLALDTETIKWEALCFFKSFYLLFLNWCVLFLIYSSLILEKSRIKSNITGKPLTIGIFTSDRNSEPYFLKTSWFQMKLI